MSFRLSPHHHSGKVQEHHHTSYGWLSVLLLIFGIALVPISEGLAATQTNSGNITVSGIMPAAAPKTAAVITSPLHGSRFSSSPISIRGTCGAGLIVKIFRNTDFAGAGTCSAVGTFNIPVSLVIGTNTLSALNYDLLGQAGPSTPGITVYFIPKQNKPRAPEALPTPDEFLFSLPLNQSYWQINPGDSITLSGIIKGGQPPYRWNINFGDGSREEGEVNLPGELKLSHMFKDSGTYEVLLIISDQSGRSHVYQVVVVVNGLPPAAPISPPWENGGILMIAWPIHFSLLFIVLLLWVRHARRETANPQLA